MTPKAQSYEHLSPGPSEARVLILEHDHSLADSIHVLLSKHERAQCRRFRDAHDRFSAATTRALLRLGASALSGQRPDLVRLIRDARGRPQIEGVSRDAMDLNVSRRPGCSVLVLARGVRCGIDIERIDPNLIDPAMLGALLTEEEQVMGLARNRLFFERWCGLEAVLKADGRGLSEGTGAAKLIEICDRGEARWVCDDAIWVTRAIQTPAGFVGQVAIAEGCDRCEQIDIGTLDVRVYSRSVCALGECG